ncbi:hypothetical protein C5B90_19135 [Haloferax sp. Atlit-12N]|nr:hypothetical protein C5B90_19135 [Haloferax sp. Atlit-12N]
MRFCEPEQNFRRRLRREVYQFSVLLANCLSLTVKRGESSILFPKDTNAFHIAVRVLSNTALNSDTHLPLVPRLLNDASVDLLSLGLGR